MSASTTQSLYSREVLRLATALPHDDRLENAQGSATRRAPVCGSEMSVDVVANNDVVAAIAIRARACALGQASAAILRSEALGKSALEIGALHQQLKRALDGNGEMPSSYAPFAYARDYPARYGAILLPFDTLLAAMQS
jgi:NifU-like protein involved in Fe-S cluster formation